PTAAGRFQQTNPHGSVEDGGSPATFVTKLNPSGSALVYSTFYTGSSRTRDQSRAIAVDGSGNAVIAGSAMGGLPMLNGFQTKPEDGPFLRTTDSGNHWNTSGDGLPIDALIGTIAADPLSPSTLYAGGATSRSSILYKSTDGGGSWSPSSNGLPAQANVSRILISSQTTSTVYVYLNDQAGNEIFQSTDGGGSWHGLNLNLQFGGNALSIFEVDARSPTTLYVGFSSDGNNRGNLFKSTDAGGSWAAITQGLTNKDVNALSIAPNDSSTLYVGTNLGLFKSND